MSHLPVALPPLPGSVPLDIIMRQGALRRRSGIRDRHDNSVTEFVCEMAKSATFEPRHEVRKRIGVARQGTQSYFRFTATNQMK